MFILYVALNLLVCILLAFHALVSSGSGADRLGEEKTLVGVLSLTDLCLFTEARYTRNPSMADPHSSFQDGPMCFDHFPSGALVVLPPHLTRHAVD